MAADAAAVVGLVGLLEGAVGAGTLVGLGGLLEAGARALVGLGGLLEAGATALVGLGGLLEGGAGGEAVSLLGVVAGAATAVRLVGPSVRATGEATAAPDVVAAATSRDGAPSAVRRGTRGHSVVTIGRRGGQGLRVEGAVAPAGGVTATARVGGAQPERWGSNVVRRATPGGAAAPVPLGPGPVPAARGVGGRREALVVPAIGLRLERFSRRDPRGRRIVPPTPGNATNRWRSFGSST